MNLVVYKHISYVAGFVASIAWLGFDPQTIGIYALLMVFDVFTGITRACVVEGCRSIRSTIGVKGILSKILVLTGLFSIGLAGKGVGFEMQSLVQAAVIVLILAETYSILGNIHSTMTRKPKVEFDAIAWILHQVRNVLLGRLPSDGH